MKVTTDSVLLGSLCKIESENKILDIGTGCGILALMMAQKSSANIVAIDVDLDSVNEAKENFNRSPWINRITVHCVDVKTFSETSKSKFDLIITNPPYFTQKIFSPNFQKHQARNTDALSYDTLLDSIEKMLSGDGSFWIVLPPIEYKKFALIATYSLFSCKMLYKISNSQHSDPVLFVAQWTKYDVGNIHKINTLSIYDSHHNYTSGFKQLTSDFYLEF